MPQLELRNHSARARRTAVDPRGLPGRWSTRVGESHLLGYWLKRRAEGQRGTLESAEGRLQLTWRRTVVNQRNPRGRQNKLFKCKYTWTVQ